ncbi:MAG: UDP-N-acetylglucosamine 1-carboxyvinyltransferase [Planctomycetes bacterium]|nr:UDP-N-acetylglucosamine 1-carboxyvinyltransferase [Planctomycetota bacterium]
MDKFIIKGSRKLKGTVTVGGSKNAALPILAATILADGKCTLRNISTLMDVRSLIDILEVLGVKTKRPQKHVLETEVKDEKPCRAPYELVRKMRASICVLGPLLAKRKRAVVSYPGGCVIGVRPIDLHLKGLRALGAKIEIKHGYLHARTDQLKGAEIYLGGPAGSTVLGTCNVLTAAVMAKGKTIIEDAACEPEVQDLCRFLISMGAEIHGVGTKRLEVKGVPELHGTGHTIIPDRIEAGTFMTAAAITNGDVEITGARMDHLGAVTDLLTRMGVSITGRNGACRVRVTRKLKPMDFATLPYPGIPTDMQPQLMTLLCLVDGTSIITDKVYPDRFMHVQELARLGADIRKEGGSAIIVGVKSLSGADVMASDLRAGAALVVAGLAAKGETTVKRVYHIDRGYEGIEVKLRKLGADITRRVDQSSDSYTP